MVSAPRWRSERGLQKVYVGRQAGRQTDKVPRERGEGGLARGEGPQPSPPNLSATFLALFESGKTHPVCPGIGKWLFLKNSFL